MKRWLACLLILASCTVGPTIVYQPTKAVVFDIDGTLTPDEFRFLEVRRDAVGVVRFYKDKGCEILYLSARPLVFEAGTREWLELQGFPRGTLRVAENEQDILHPDRFKTRVLKEFLSKGWRFAAAYGESTTDFIAYSAVGIPHVFALRRVGDADCQPGAWEQCLEGWTAHINYIQGKELL